jgi:hypothetical protein
VGKVNVNTSGSITFRYNLGHYQGMNTQAPENKSEYRRKKLRELISIHYGGVDAALAARIGVDPSYISRCLYPEGKAGKKNIGEKMIEKIEAVHPGWFQNAYLRQLAHFFLGMSQEHQDDLLKIANQLYTIDNPQDRAANPFPEKVRWKESEPESAKSSEQISE